MKSVHAIRIVPFVLLLVALTSEAATGQINTGEIGGVVRDTTGAILPGADVVAHHASTGFSSTRVSDSGGRFFFPALQSGEWEITVSAPGSSAATPLPTSFWGIRFQRDPGWEKAGRTLAPTGFICTSRTTGE